MTGTICSGRSFFLDDVSSFFCFRPRCIVAQPLLSTAIGSCGFQPQPASHQDTRNLFTTLSTINTFFSSSSPFRPQQHSLFYHPLSRTGPHYHCLWLLRFKNFPIRLLLPAAASLLSYFFFYWILVIHHSILDIIFN